MHTVKAISLDLDDTLWPIWPVIERAENQLHEFLVRHAPETAQKFPIPAMRHLREQVAQAHPELAHDYTAQRKISLSHALRLGGDSETLMEPAFEAFYHARNAVDFYADCLPALERLSSRYPLVALTNGNADLEQTGIARFFTGCISAKTVGTAKPHAAIFEAARIHLGFNAEQILHIGDDPWLDIEGAQAAGFRSAWVNRKQECWPAELKHADITVIDLSQLADLLEEVTA
jgi:2-haloalkanoic acid dehalogenase type II